jgi:hypothetical protein
MAITRLIIQRIKARLRVRCFSDESCCESAP